MSGISFHQHHAVTMALLLMLSSSPPATAREADTPGFDALWGRANLYDAPDGSFLRHLALSGRAHGDYAWVDADEGDYDDLRWRRLGEPEVARRLLRRLLALRPDHRDSLRTATELASAAAQVARDAQVAYVQEEGYKTIFRPPQGETVEAVAMVKVLVDRVGVQYRRPIQLLAQLNQRAVQRHQLLDQRRLPLSDGVFLFR